MAISCNSKPKETDEEVGHDTRIPFESSANLHCDISRQVSVSWVSRPLKGHLNIGCLRNFFLKCFPKQSRQVSLYVHTKGRELYVGEP
jgi:hypothetical protein